MKANQLYAHLEKDFIKPNMSDEWIQYMDPIINFLSENFKRRSMGLVCDFAIEINKVYTAVFPSKKVMQKIINDGARNSMLFVHHPCVWDLKSEEGPWYNMDQTSLKHFKKNNISIYNLHTPLDNIGLYSTSLSFAKVLEIELIKPFGFHNGALCGIIGKTSCNTINELKEKLEKVVGHETNLFHYGSNFLEKGIVAVIAGGGNDVNFLKEILDGGASTLITGIIIKNDYSNAAHEFAKENKINFLGATHYSTEKFSCQNMCNYFRKLGLISKFISDNPCMHDLK